VSRVAKKPIEIPKGVEVKIENGTVSMKGPKGELSRELRADVTASIEEGVIKVAPANDEAWAHAGTARALLNNMAQGVSQGIRVELELRGVGYRAAAQGNSAVQLSLGYSHPVVHQLPQGVTVETPSQTSIVLLGIDRQKVNEEAAKIRRYREPENYKGKGIRYLNEKVLIKETKKK